MVPAMMDAMSAQQATGLFLGRLAFAGWAIRGLIVLLIAVLWVFGWLVLILARAILGRLLALLAGLLLIILVAGLLLGIAFPGLGVAGLLVLALVAGIRAGHHLLLLLQGLFERITEQFEEACGGLAVVGGVLVRRVGLQCGVVVPHGVGPVQHHRLEQPVAAGKRFILGLLLHPLGELADDVPA